MVVSVVHHGKNGGCSWDVEVYMGVEPKIGFFYHPNHPFGNRVFHYKPSILGIPLFLEIPIFCLFSLMWS